MREQLCQLIQVPQRDWDEANLEQDEATEQWVVSSWLLTQQCLQDLCLLLRGRWSRLHLQCCLPLLQRYLLSRKRKKRTHQETTSRTWLLKKLARLMTLSASTSISASFVKNYLYMRRIGCKQNNKLTRRVQGRPPLQVGLCPSVPVGRSVGNPPGW